MAFNHFRLLVVASVNPTGWLCRLFSIFLQGFFDLVNPFLVIPLHFLRLLESIIQNLPRSRFDGLLQVEALKEDHSRETFQRAFISLLLFEYPFFFSLEVGPERHIQGFGHSVDSKVASENTRSVNTYSLLF